MKRFQSRPLTGFVFRKSSINTASCMNINLKNRSLMSSEAETIISTLPMFTCPFRSASCSLIFIYTMPPTSINRKAK